MNLDSVRAQAKAVGIGPLAAVAAGLAWKRYRVPLLAVGVVWGLANVLFSKREISATVTAEEPTITYPVADPAPSPNARTDEPLEPGADYAIN